MPVTVLGPSSHMASRTHLSPTSDNARPGRSILAGCARSSNHSVSEIIRFSRGAGAYEGSDTRQIIYPPGRCMYRLFTSGNTMHETAAFTEATGVEEVLSTVIASRGLKQLLCSMQLPFY